MSNINIFLKALLCDRSKSSGSWESSHLSPCVPCIWGDVCAVVAGGQLGANAACEGRDINKTDSYNTRQIEESKYIGDQINSRVAKDRSEPEVGEQEPAAPDWRSNCQWLRSAAPMQCHVCLHSQINQ